MTDSAQTENTTEPRRPKDRSPSFPFIPLQTAVDRLVAFEKSFGRHMTPADKVGLAWGMKAKSSQGDQTLAALRSFGLLTYEGTGSERQVSLTDEGRTYLRAQQDSMKKQVLKQAALRPKMIRKFWATWGADRPMDAVALDELTLKNGFSDAGADNFLRVYDATISFAGLGDSDKVILPDQPDGEDANDLSTPPAPEVKIGDFVQWAPNGVEQFKTSRKVVNVENGFVFVHGSPTGMPMSEVAVSEAPAPPKPIPPGSPPFVGQAASAGPAADINVYLTGNRLQITADIDKDGLDKLKKILEKYEEILKLLN